MASRKNYHGFGMRFYPRNGPVYVDHRKSNELIRVLASYGLIKKELTKQNLGKGHLVHCNKSQHKLLLRLNPRCGRMGKVTDTDRHLLPAIFTALQRGASRLLGWRNWRAKEPTSGSNTMIYR